MGSIFVGTSGYSYKGWDKTFYPPTTPKKRQLEYYATQFRTVEINATFYRLPSAGMVQGWRNRTNKQFVYAIKGSRFITHMKKLANLGDALDVFFERIAPLRERIGVILWQLPPNLHLDVGGLDEFLKRAPKGYCHAVEFRHPSWLEKDVFDVLRARKAAHVSVSSRGMPMDLTVTSPVVYIRFHGLAGGAAHDYTDEELEPWAAHIRSQAAAGKTIYVYFNNDINTRVPDNARTLIRMVT